MRLRSEYPYLFHFDLPLANLLTAGKGYRHHQAKNLIDQAAVVVAVVVAEDFEIALAADVLYDPDRFAHGLGSHR